MMNGDAIKMLFTLKPEEAMEYFRKKGVAVSPNGWKDLWQEANARAFTVAKLLDMEILSDLKAGIQEAMDSGSTVRDFLKKFEADFEKKGFTGLAPHRLDNIWKTNIGVAFNVGRYKQLEEVKRVRPYWRYMGILDKSTRPSHADMFGKTYPADHVIWDTWYPPNGFRCRCWVESLTAEDMEAMGLNPDRNIPQDEKGRDIVPDEGWRYNPGKAGMGSIPGKGVGKSDVNLEAALPGIAGARDKYFASMAEGKKTALVKRDMNRYAQAMEGLSAEEYAIEKRRILESLLGYDSLRADAAEKLVEGLPHMSNRLLLDLHRNGIKVSLINSDGRASYNRATKRIVLYEKGQASFGFKDSVAHEFGHAVDYMLCTYDGAPLKGAGNWVKTPYTTAADQKKYKTWFVKNIDKKRKPGNFENGDGKFWRGNFLEDYDARIYAGRGGKNFGEQWFAMNTQRYGAYARQLENIGQVSREYIEGRIKTLDTMIKRDKEYLQWKKGKVAELDEYNKRKKELEYFQAKRDRHLKILQAMDAGDDKTIAKYYTDWYKVEDAHPEFAAFLDDFYGRRTR